MLVIVGLGNIGNQYKLTRHNVGFLIADNLASALNYPPFTTKNNYLFSLNNINNTKVALLKPTTFMNLSGSAVLSFCSYYKVLPSDIIVIQDDIDLPLGTLRYKTNSSDGGHNGIKDIHNKIGKNIARLKIGVGRPTNTNIDTASHVLANFTPEELVIIEKIGQEFVNNISLLLNKEFTEFVNNVNKNVRN